MRTKLRDKMQEKNITPQALADILKCDISYIYKIRRGERNPTLKDAEIIANALDSTVDELFCNQKKDVMSREKTA